MSSKIRTNATLSSKCSATAARPRGGTNRSLDGRMSDTQSLQRFHSSTSLSQCACTVSFAVHFPMPTGPARPVERSSCSRICRAARSPHTAARSARSIFMHHIGVRASESGGLKRANVVFHVRPPSALLSAKKPFCALFQPNMRGFDSVGSSRERTRTTFPQRRTHWLIVLRLRRPPVRCFTHYDVSIRRCLVSLAVAVEQQRISIPCLDDLRDGPDVRGRGRHAKRG